MAQPTKIISCRIPQELHEKIADEITEAGCTMSEWLFIRITAYDRLAEKKKFYLRYLEQLEKVLAEGHTVQGAEVINYLRKFFANVN